MVSKRLIIGTVLTLVLALQIGCSGTGIEKSPNSGEAPKQETTNTSTSTTDTSANNQADKQNNQEDKQKAIMDEFSELIAQSDNLAEVFEFVNQNISLLSKENASHMVSGLEDLQKKNLPKMEEKFYRDDSIQDKLNKAYNPGFDLNAIDNIEDKELKNLLAETRNTGYKVETAEGMFFPIINYASYKKYASYVTPDIKDYIDIMAVESDKVPAKDAALVISWDEVLKRTLCQEKFINQYPHSMKLNDVKQLYKKYVSFSLFGLNNTPLFSYNSKTMSDDAKSVYKKAVESNENSKFLDTLRGFLDVLEQDNYRLTDKVEEYRKNALESI